MSVWTSKYAIMRDLSKAQGRLVPVDISSSAGVAVAANEKPPQLATEKTEEEFYTKYGSGDVEYNIAPDLGLIQHMLEMVRVDDNDCSDSDIDNDMIKTNLTSDLYEVTKVNKTEAKFDPKNTKVKPKKAKPKEQAKFKPVEAKLKLKPAVLKPGGDAPIKEKRQRNAAVLSLLEALESKENDNNNNNESIKLLKPTDFMTNKAVTDSVRKVDEWFTNEENSVAKTVSLNAVPMFKKKSASEKSMQQLRKENRLQISPTKSTGAFKPSSKADEYYKKYLEKSQLNECIREDIWQKAERLMKEADKKRAAKAAMIDETSDSTADVLQQSSNDADAILTEDDSSTKMDYALTEPRHGNVEDEDCLVCTTVRKHGYKIENKNMTSIEKEHSSTDDCEIAGGHE